METPVNITSAHDHFRTRCSEAVNTHRTRYDAKQVLVRFGEFTEDVVSTVLYLIENKMEEWGERKGIIKRVFSIIVEQLQNIRINGAIDDSGQQPGFIVVSKAENTYYVTTLNFSSNNNVEAIRNKVNKVHHLKSDELKQLYMETLSEGKISHKGGAGLGFITIAMKSNNEFDFSFEQINDSLTLFTLNIRVQAE